MNGFFLERKKNTKWEFIYVKPPQPAEGFKVVPLVLLGVL